MILGLLKKLVIFAYYSTVFIAFFRNIILTYIYVQFLFYLDFQELKKNLENFFLALTSLILEKNIF